MSTYLKALLALATVTAFLSVTYGLLKFGEAHGKTACENKQLASDNASLLQSAKKIVGVFEGYEKALAEIDTFPKDKGVVPPVIKRSIDLVPGPAISTTKDTKRGVVRSSNQASK